MATPQLYRQLFEQLGQWIIPKDLRHLKNCAEIVAAILASESACAAHWIPYLSHRDCQARSHMERLSYFMNNPFSFMAKDLAELNLDSKIINLVLLISYGQKLGMLKL